MSKYNLDLELSRELYKRKLITNAEYWWGFDGMTWDICRGKPNEGDIPLPIAEELLEKLPKKIEDENRWYQLNITFNPETMKYVIAYFDFGDHNIAMDGNDGLWFGYNDIFCKTDIKIALASMLIYLDDKGYLKK